MKPMQKRKNNQLQPICNFSITLVFKAGVFNLEKYG